MRDKIECGVFYLKHYKGWLDRFIEKVNTHTDKIQFIQIDISAFVACDKFTVGKHDFPAPTVLRDLSVLFERYDSLILPIMPDTLIWTRIMMGQLSHLPRYPIVALPHNIKPIALVDLAGLGMSEYIFESDDMTVLRARLLNIIERQKLLNKSQYLLQQTLMHQRYSSLNNVAPEAPVTPLKNYEELATLLDERPINVSLERVNLKPKPLRRRKAIWSRVSPIEHINYSDTFQVAKSKVLAEFERKYIVYALAKAEGNIGIAAEKSNKHRRSFWELMRKHDIDAADFKRK